MKRALAIILLSSMLLLNTACNRQEEIGASTSDSQINSIISSNKVITVPEVVIMKTAVFQLGKDNTTTKTLSIDDTIGDWTVSDIEVVYQNDYVDRIEAIFEGDVTISGTISPSGFSGGGYDFIVSDSDINKMPYCILEEVDLDKQKMFMLNLEETIENLPVFGADGSALCTITVSKYRFISAPMGAFPSASATKIEYI